MSNDWNFLSDTLRKVGAHRERIGAKSVKEVMANKVKVKAVKTARQKKIDDDIRARRAARKKKRIEVEGGYIE